MKKLSNPQTQKVVKELTDVLTMSFLRNELIGEKIFRGNRQGLQVFMSLMVRYYLKHAQIFASENNEGKIVACALFLEYPNQKNIEVSSVLKDGGINGLYKLIFCIGVCNLMRLLKMESILMKNHYPKKHAYLCMLASIEKGKGGELLDYCKEYYKNKTIYIESSVDKNNHEFYRKHGFDEIGRVTTFGYENVCFIS